MTDAQDPLEGVDGGPMAWMARNPVVANLNMICLLAGGALMVAPPLSAPRGWLLQTLSARVVRTAWPQNAALGMIGAVCRGIAVGTRGRANK